MIVSARSDDAVFLRGWEERQHHSLILRRAPVTGHRVAAGLPRPDRGRPGPAAEHFAGRGSDHALDRRRL